VHGGQGAGFVIALGLVLAVACGGSTPGPASGRPSPNRASSQPVTAPLSAWQKLGATQVPPASIQQASRGAAAVVNQTGGAVSDADARAWVLAFVRTFAYLRWAVSTGQSEFLLRSGLSTAPLAVFQPNVNDIARARAAGDHVEYTLQTFRRFVVRSMPQSLQPSIQRVEEVWKPYAIYLDAVGPVETDWIDPQGNRTVKSQVGPGIPLFELVGGELSHDPVMGDVWVFASDFDCTAASSRQTLAPLCNP
jgi:hypothetical protein